MNRQLRKSMLRSRLKHEYTKCPTLDNEQLQKTKELLFELNKKVQKIVL